MIVTVTPTIMDGTVVRWYYDETPLAELSSHQPQVSASRHGVLVHAYLHTLPDGLLTLAQDVCRQLQRDRDADVRHLATHRRRSLFGPYEPIPAGQGAVG